MCSVGCCTCNNMPIRGDIFEKGKVVHIISRAVEGRKIFDNEEDCLRFIFQSYAFNIGRPARNLWRQDVIKLANAILNGEEISSQFVIKEHEPLVSFLDFALVINHDHFFLVSNLDNAIPIYFKKLNNGFAQYFNLKYNRKGTLFDGRYRAVIAKTQFQADAISRYISVINPLDVFQPGWREDGLNNPTEAFKFLRSYKFSSFPDKVGARKSKILAPPDILEEYLSINSENDYREFMEEFLRERSNNLRDLFLE